MRGAGHATGRTTGVPCPFTNGQRYITHLNTAWNSHAKNASVRRSASFRNLPTLFIQITPFLSDLVFFVISAISFATSSLGIPGTSGTAA